LGSLYPAEDFEEKIHPRSFKNHRCFYSTISQLRITIAQCADVFC